MTDARLLNEFRARLVERSRLTALQKPIIRDLAPGQDWFRIKNIAAGEAAVYIHDEIGMWGTTAQGFIDQLGAITAPKITVYVNSPGGEVFDGMAIHTALATSKAHVTTFNTGLAASAASCIMMAGDTIKTARNALWMLHDASGGTWGNAAAHRANAELLDKVSLNIADMYAMQAGGTAAEWFALIENSERWYTGQEALAAGLADEMTDPDEEETEDSAPSARRLSMAAFNYAGRAEAPPPPAPFAGVKLAVDTPPPPNPSTEGNAEAEDSPVAEEEAAEEDLPDLEEGETLFNSSEEQALTMLAFLAERLKSL